MHRKFLVVVNLVILIVTGVNLKAIAQPKKDHNKPKTSATDLCINRRVRCQITFEKTVSINPQINEANQQFREQFFLASKTYPELSNPNSPLIKQQFQLPTALQLGKGEVVINIRNRLYSFPDYIKTDTVDDDDTAIYASAGFSWGITDRSELTLEYQRFDSAFPVIQGDLASITRKGDNEGTLEFKQRLWQNPSKTQFLSGIVSLSFPLIERGSQLKRNGRVVFEETRSDIVPAIELPFTYTPNDRLTLTFSPAIAFFKEESALFLRRLPSEDSESFGTTFGVIGAASYRLNERLSIWGDTFLPITGNNSIDRESGKPDKTISYNAGFRYLVNPRLGIDVFASNTLGSVGSLALTADKDLLAFGTSIVFMPDFIGTNRKYASSFDRYSEAKNTPITTDGIGFFDGGTLASGKALVNIQGGTQGIMTSLRYGLLQDIEASLFLDYVFGEVDESEQGVGAKIRLLNQAAGAPFTASLAGTLGISNQPLINFTENNRNEYERRDLSKSIPLLYPGADNGDEGELYLFTVSLPLQYQFNNGAALWLTPLWAYGQRNGTATAGFNLGGSVPIARDFSILGEVGANFAGEGNVFLGDKLGDAIPWNVGIRWDLAHLFNLDKSKNPNSPQLELYLTNRVGSSVWHQLRVRDRDQTAITIGLSFPF